MIQRLSNLEGKHWSTRKDGGSKVSSEIAPYAGVCYLSGPMTGLPNFNKDSFVRGAELLRRAGWFVFNPVENDAEAGIELDGTSGTENFDFHAAMARDLMQVCQSDALFVLPGWEYSTGAEIETWVAHRMGIPVYSLLEGTQVDPPLIQAHPFSIMHAHDSAGFGADTNAYEEIAIEKLELLPVDPAERKAIPITTGVLDYFSAALIEVAKVSKAGNDQHNPGQPLHWARGKSTDQADTLVRHLLERGGIDSDGMRHSAKMAWRALALLQLELEEAGEAPLARGAREVV